MAVLLDSIVAKDTLPLWFICGLVIGLYWIATKTDIAYIKGLPELPNALPVLGHLHQLGKDHATAFQQLSQRHKLSTFQVRLGSKRAVVFNSFKDSCRILQTFSAATIDRPKLYTFHGVISSTQGFSVGSSPWDESCRRKRKAASAALSRAAIREYEDMLDWESCRLISRFFESSNSIGDFSVKPFVQRYALSTSLTLCYGVRMTTSADHDALVEEILEVGSGISLLRSASENYQDYIPLLQWLPSEKNQRGQNLRARRDGYVGRLMAIARDRIAEGINQPCVSDPVLKGEMEESKLTKEELASICLSLISGGFESIPSTLMMIIGTLGTFEGQQMQEAAYRDILRHYSSTEEAWADSFKEDKVPYLNALVKETLRHYTVTAMIPPRMTATDVQWDDKSIIPANTMILVNAQAANHDVEHFGPTANVFDPTRWLKPDLNTPEEIPRAGLPHLAFGAGSRNCVGAALGHRLIYNALLRLISCFRIEASEKDPPTVDSIEYNAAKSAMVAHAKDFKIRLIAREGENPAALLQQARERTSQVI